VASVVEAQRDGRALISSAVVLRDGQALELPEPYRKLLDRTDIGDLVRQWGQLPGGDPTGISLEDRVLAERELGTLV